MACHQEYMYKTQAPFAPVTSTLTLNIHQRASHDTKGRKRGLAMTKGLLDVSRLPLLNKIHRRQRDIQVAPNKIRQ